MSVYWYLACEAHEEFCDAASSHASGNAGHLCSSDKVLPQFIFRHRECALSVLSEFRDREMCLWTEIPSWKAARYWPLNGEKCPKCGEEYHHHKAFGPPDPDIAAQFADPKVNHLF